LRFRTFSLTLRIAFGKGKERLADTLNVSADVAKSFTTSFLGKEQLYTTFIPWNIHEDGIM
jgi:hypothetical protein